MDFSNFNLSMFMSRPHSVHMILTTDPVRSTLKFLLPQGWGFFNSKISLTSNLIISKNTLQDRKALLLIIT